MGMTQSIERDSRIIVIFLAHLKMAPYDYVKQLAIQGYPVSVICAGGDGHQPKKLMEKVEIIPFNKKANKWQFISNQLEIIHLIKKIIWETKQKQYIVHCMGSADLGLLPYLAGWFISSDNRLKWILDVRTGYLRAGLKEALWLWSLKLAARRYDYLLFIDDYLLERFHAALPQHRADILPLGVDSDLFYPDAASRDRGRQALGVANQDFVFLYGGVLSPNRRLERIIQAFHLCRQMAPTASRLKLVFAGDGPALGHLQAMTQELGLAQDVCFPGNVPYESYPDMVNAADAALAIIPMTPQYEPQPPKKTVEYLACAKPVIASATMGNRRFIRHLENGLLIGDGPEEIAAAMTLLWQDQELRQTLSKQARSSISPYEMKTLGQHLSRIYGRLLA
jgi:glycosyltransferase involved in cell wall biosynthesis